MKSLSKFTSIAALLVLCSATLFAQYIPDPPPQNNAASAAVGPAGAVVNSSGLNITVSPGPAYCQGDMAIIGSTLFTLQANQSYHVILDCATFGVKAQQIAAAGKLQIELATVTCGASTCGTITDTRTAAQFPNTADGTYIVPLEACGLNLTVGALAAASTTGQLPGITRPASGNHVLQISTTAAANTIQLDCDITPPSKLTTGKGATINNVQVLYGYQTTALTTITGPVFNTVTYSATGGAAAGTVAAAGGVITVTAGTNHATPGAVTTTGQCYSENASFGTPFPFATDLQRLTMEEQFAQSAAAVTVFQVCGVIVHYSYIPL